MIPSAHIYISQNRREIIVSSTGVTFEGVYYEQENGAVAYPLDIPPATLGTGVRSAIANFAHAEDNTAVVRQMTWAALRVSKAKSIRAFQSRTIYVGVRFNGNEFEFRGSAFEDRKTVVDRGLPSHSSDEQIGDMVFEVFWKLRKTQYH